MAKQFYRNLARIFSFVQKRDTSFSEWLMKLVVTAEF